jgi:c-di-GMP phosphodiesterase
MSIFVARQPIFDRDGRLSGYELLYRRNAEMAFADGDDCNTMSARVIANAFLGMNMRELTGDVRSFVNLTREQLLESTYEVLDRQRVVIELLENITYDEETMDACRAMHGAGYTIALDDFEFDEAYLPILELTSIVKIVTMGRSNDALRAIVEQLRPFDVMMLAEKVETREDFERCKALGFDFFQGYFYARPETFSHPNVEVGNASTIRLLNLLQDPTSNDHDIERAFAADPGLTYKLMRIVNSAAMGAQGIDSIRHAVRLVGRATLHRWVCVLLTASFAERGGVQKELALTALARARLCELLANRLPGSPSADTLFMTGLLSRMDALMRVPMAKVLDGIQVTSASEHALLSRTGKQAPFLLLTEAYESGAWNEVRELATDIGVPPEVVAGLYRESISWAQQTFTGRAA